MINKLLVALSIFIISLHPIHVNTEGFKYVEIFDPKQDKVVKIVQLNQQIQEIIANWITKIEGIYKNDPVIDDGYMITIPLDPTIKVKGSSLNVLVSEVYILIPENGPPCYLIFEDENKLLSFPFNGDIDLLSNLLDFKLKK